MATESADPFCVVPPEVLLAILQFVPNLQSLQSLRCASPAVNSLLREDGLAAEIVEAILSSRLVYPTRVDIRLAVMVAWGPDPANNLLSQPDMFREARFGKQREVRWMQHDCSQVAGHQPLTRCKRLPSLAIQRVLALSTQVHRLAYGCFGVMLDRVITHPPRRAADPTATFQAYVRAFQQAEWNREPVPERGPLPDSEPVPIWPEARAPPSQGEEQRFEAHAWAYALESLCRPDPAETDSETELWLQAVQRLLRPPDDPHVVWGPERLWGCVALEEVRLVNAIAKLPPSKEACWGAEPLYDAGEHWTGRSADPQVVPEDRLLGLSLLRVNLRDFHRARLWEPWSLVYKGHSTQWNLLGLEDAWSRTRLRALGYLARKDRDLYRRGVRGGPQEYSNKVEEMLFAWRSVMTDEEVHKMQQAARADWERRRSHADFDASADADQE